MLDYVDGVTAAMFLESLLPQPPFRDVEAMLADKFASWPYTPLPSSRGRIYRPTGRMPLDIGDWAYCPTTSGSLWLVLAVDRASEDTVLLAVLRELGLPKFGKVVALWTCAHNAPRAMRCLPAPPAGT